MSKIRNFFILLFVLNFFGEYCISQEIKISKKAISKIVKQADASLKSYDFETSLQLSRKALTLSKEIKDDFLIASCYNTIASNYYDLSEFDKAIFYYTKGLGYAQKINNLSLLYKLNNNLGNVYSFEKKQFQNGVNYHLKALNYANQLKDKNLVVFSKLNLTWIYFDQGYFEKGKSFLDFVNKNKAEFLTDDDCISLNMLNGMYFEHVKNYKKANVFFLKAIELGKASANQNDLSNSYYEYSQFLNGIGDTKNAYYFLKLHNLLEDDIYNEEKLKKGNVIGLNLELDEYKRKVVEIELEKKFQSQSLKKSKTIVFMFFIILTIVLILLFTIYRNSIFKQRINSKLLDSNAELVIANSKIEESAKLKTQFISTISHELRTPLYGVIGIADMLADEHKELASSPYLNSLKFSARYLLELVNDVLQINKIDENRIVLENLNFNIYDEIVLIKNSLSFIAKNNNNKFNILVDSAIPEYLIGDKLRFAQIMMNLVSNALKYTHDGEVFIEADLVQIEGDTHFIEFKISDTGEGIAPENLEKVFDTFVQIGRKEEDYQGTGLGLAIVKRLLDLFGSKIHLESELGKGSVFSFTIPFDCNLEKTIEIINGIDVDLRNLELFQVLVVEDNKINQLVTKKIIEKYNYNCFIVENGFEAIELLKTQIFDVILMDINMPVMNGFETTKKIRESGISTPIIALTAFAKEEIIDQAVAAGMNDIIVKPFEPSQLLTLINHQIVEEKKR